MTALMRLMVIHVSTAIPACPVRPRADIGPLARAGFCCVPKQKWANWKFCAISKGRPPLRSGLAMVFGSSWPPGHQQRRGTRSGRHTYFFLDVGHHRVRQAYLAEYREVLRDDVLP